MKDPLDCTKTSEELDNLVITARIDIAAHEERFKRLEREVVDMLDLSPEATGTGRRISTEIRDKMISLKKDTAHFTSRLHSRFGDLAPLSERSQDRNEFQGFCNRIDCVEEQLTSLERRCDIADDFDSLPPHPKKRIVSRARRVRFTSVSGEVDDEPGSIYD